MKLIFAFLLALSVSGCTLHPLHPGGGNGQLAQTLKSVEVAPIGSGKAGWLVRTALEDRLATSGAAPQYRLMVELDDDITGFGIRSDNSVTRERRTLRARYQLVDAALGTVVLDATAGSDTGIDVSSSEYATVAAEQTALERLSNQVADQIIARVALYFARSGENR